MDFYLPDDARELHCHIAIFNDTDQTLPMYWWSNTAVPELPGGRVLTPARSAFTNRENRILQVDIPLADGTDVTYPENLERPVDYFYRLEEKRPRFEAYLDADGRGLVQFSTRRRKPEKRRSDRKRPRPEALCLGQPHCRTKLAAGPHRTGGALSGNSGRGSQNPIRMSAHAASNGVGLGGMLRPPGSGSG